MDSFLGAIYAAGAGHRVCGVLVRPFSHWHMVQLQAIQSPLLGASERLPWGGAADLAFASGVCRTQFPQTFSPPTGIRGLLWRMRTAWRVRDVQKIVDANAAWAAYISDCTQSAEVAQAAGNCRCRVPAPLAVVSRLIRFGIVHGEAWDLPVGYARWLFYGLSEANGAQLDLVDDALAAAFREAGV